MKKILLTGPDGILGNNLIPLLIHKGYEVRALIQTGKDHALTAEMGAETVSGDILNSEEVVAAAKGCDYVIHAAANTNVWPPRSKMVHEVNITGTKNIVEAVKRCGIKKLIHIGTANSFCPGTKEKPGNETGTYAGWPYHLDYMDSKYLAQKLVLKEIAENRLPAVIVNPTFMIGAYDYKPSSGQLIISVCKGKVPGYTLGGRNYIFVRDAATAIVNSLEKGRIGECYILGNENLNYKEFFGIVAGVTGRKPPSRYFSPWITLAFGRLNSLLGSLFHYNPGLSYPLAKVSLDENYYSPQKAVEELDLPRTPVAEAVKIAYEWLKSNSYI